MHSSTVLDHFKNPRNGGELPGATASVDVSNPVCGDILRLAARVESGCIAEIRFKCQGCVVSLASASALTELVAGQSLSEARRVTAADVSAHLGGLPQASFHGAQLAADALATLLSKLPA